MRRTFGRAGASWIGTVIALVMIGWWTVQTELFANAAIELLTRLLHIDPPRQLVVMIGGFWMISIAMVAVRTSGRLAPLVPFLITCMCYLQWRMQDFPLADLGSVALALIVLATWFVNLCNLQCAALGLVSVFPAGRRGQLTLAAGLIGTIIAELHFSSAMVSPLVLSGIAIAPATAMLFAAKVLITRMSPDRLSPVRVPPRAAGREPKELAGSKH